MRAETVTTVTSSSDQRFSLTYQPLSTVEPQSPQSAHQSDRTIMSPSDSRCEEDATMNGLELGFVGNKSVYSPTDRDESAEGAKGSGLVRLEGSSQDSTSSAVSSDSTLSSSSSSRRRKVSFLNQVTVKIIDEPGLSRSPLKQISLDDIPVKTICRPFGAIDIMVEAKQQFMEQGGIDVHSITSDEKEDQLELLVYSNGAEFSNEAAGSKSTATLTSLLITVLRRKEILLCVSLYGLGAFCVTLSAELFPLWAVTDARDSGLGYGPQAIGLSTGICGLGSVFLQLVVYPRLAESLGVVRMFRLGATLFSMSSFFLPSSVPLASFFFFWAGNVWPARCFALLLQMLCVVTANWILISVFVLINNSCYSHQRATVNGIGQTFASFGRLIGPLLGAPLFAWSEGNNLPWPLNFCLTWNVLSLLALVTAQLSYLLPRTIERQKREPRPSRQVESEFAARLSAEAESRPALHSLPNPIVFPDWTAVKSSDDEMDPSPIEVTAANFEVSPLSDAESAIGLRGGSEQNSISLRNLLRRSKPLFSD